MPTWNKLSKLDELGYGLNTYGTSPWGGIWNTISRVISSWTKIGKVSDGWSKLPKV